MRRLSASDIVLKALGLTILGITTPILEHIDIAEQLRTGTWLVLFHHQVCPDRQKTIGQYEQMARDLAGQENFLRIALIEVPPYEEAIALPNSACTPGRLADTKDWFVKTPAIILTHNGPVEATWEGKRPDSWSACPNMPKLLPRNRRFT